MGASFITKEVSRERNMDNLMQDFPLRVTSIIDHAAKYHPERKIISKDTKGKITNTNYKEVHRNSKKVVILMTFAIISAILTNQQCMISLGHHT